MRLIKILGLTAVAALSALSFVAAGSASAAQQDLCRFTGVMGELTKEGCEQIGGTIEPGPSEFKAKALNPVLTGTITEKCGKSDTTATVTGNSEGAEVLIETLTFEEGCTPCSTVTSNNLPYHGKMTMVGSEYFLESPGSATLSNCTFGVSCKFGTSNAKLRLALSENMEENELRAEGIELTLEEGSKLLCGSKGTWTANYKITKPAGRWFVFLL